ncbi:DUF1629 domain-containing protein [Hyphomonas sp.]|uniref:imm11 family protein n=1 Tax=Hyphomonas sp. TaxID=87 RepID=UPI00329724A1
MIEEIEPDTHQFVSVEFIVEDGSHLEKCWFWQICNRLDTVHHEKTEHVLYKGLGWMAPPLATSNSPSKHVFDNCQIKNAKFWHDKHISGSSFCAYHVRIRLDDAGVTGIRFKHYGRPEGRPGYAA